MTVDTDDRHRVIALLDDIIGTTNRTLRVAGYEQLKAALLAHIDADGHEGRAGTGEGAHQIADIRRLIDAIGATSISSDLWIEQIGELNHAVREHFRLHQTGEA
ncbi:hypothetical protein [Asticcacaulis sp. YBE204]|uniref:hypothetical protein n=1 Tax=Asticcacaulis sp. YBE204 TaxID=1282363 RepID=UPI0003C3B4F1|nr:hypothetical protein [Asticcacaulis sp. YBE204]ESQ77860.1 hypothetical protein AEYBE204_17170 [Asticcacaulis sp. YBE204]